MRISKQQRLNVADLDILPADAAVLRWWNPYHPYHEAFVKLDASARGHGSKQAAAPSLFLSVGSSAALGVMLGFVLSLGLPLNAYFPIAGYPGSTRMDNWIAYVGFSMLLSGNSGWPIQWDPGLATPKWQLVMTVHCFFGVGLVPCIIAHWTGYQERYILWYWLQLVPLAALFMPMIQGVV